MGYAKLSIVCFIRFLLQLIIDLDKSAGNFIITLIPFYDILKEQQQKNIYNLIVIRCGAGTFQNQTTRQNCEGSECAGSHVRALWEGVPHARPPAGTLCCTYGRQSLQMREMRQSLPTSEEPQTTPADRYLLAQHLLRVQILRNHVQETSQLE